eukprot:745643-Hanusia_phi.AAC.1
MAGRRVAGVLRTCAASPLLSSSRATSSSSSSSSSFSSTHLSSRAPTRSTTSSYSNRIQSCTICYLQFLQGAKTAPSSFRCVSLSPPLEFSRDFPSRAMTTWKRAQDEDQWQILKQGAALGLASLFAGAAWALSSRETSCEPKPEDEDEFTPEQRKALPAPGQAKDLKFYTKAQVAQHVSREAGGIWVTYKDGVYDITEFIEGHPGGASKILLAAGKAIDPYWNIFQQVRHHHHLFLKLTRFPSTLGQASLFRFSSPCESGR